MRNTIILTFVLLVAVVAMAIKYFSEISGSQNNLDRVLRHIPQDAALILNFNNDESFYDIFSDYELFDAIIGKSRAEEIEQLQQYLLREPQLAEATQEKKIFVSFHPAKNDSVHFLYSINLNDDLKTSNIEELLSEIHDLSVKKAERPGLYQLSLPSLKKTFYLFIENGAATGSFSKELLETSIDNNTPKLDENFINEIKSQSSQNLNSPVNLFVNHEKVSAFLNHFIKGKANGNRNLISNLKGISSLNMNFKSDALMFNGISKPDTTAPSYLNIFLHQHPVKNDIKNIIPDNAANFIAFGLSDYSGFQKRLQVLFDKRKESAILQNHLRLIKEKSGIDLETDMRPLLANEFSVIETSYREKFAIIKLKNGRKLNFAMQLIASPAGESVSKFNYSHILYAFLGDPLKPFVRPYFSVIDNYLIVANTPGVISNYLKNYEQEKFLAKKSEFVKFSQLVANQSNILYFINQKESERIIRTSLKQNYSRAFTSKNYGLKNFYGLSYQWSADAEHFFTNIYINYISDNNSEMKAAWKIKLNGRLAITPQTVQNGETQLILVQDRSNILYAISAEGEKLWSKQLESKILGQIQQPGDGSILFNTTGKLYRMNIGGEAEQGFPVNLPYNSTFGLSLSSSNSDARLFIPAGNVIMAYDLKGTKLPDWNKTVSGKILFDLKTASLEGTDYLITATQNGNFYFYNQNGTLIKNIAYGRPLKNPIGLELSAGSNSEVITADSSGALVKISFKGSIKSKKLFEPQGDFTFDYQNIAGDESAEFIYLDKNGLNVFSSEESPLFTYNFNKPLKTKPLFFHTNKYKFQLGLNDGENNRLLLLTDEGTLARGFPVKGSGYFLVAKIKNDTHQYLITGDKDYFLSAYKL
ncbi:hypothetical protein [Desertivirga xinjiangensis]|uniref:hypothetical protein n=1 Tax=Desertivirga xinjiangensis TaxID=539206 RepID=UPI00210BDF8D|nr:hypothetical protein [Pedobacter xinjiangensis]